MRTRGPANDHLLAKEVAAASRPAVAQAKSAAGCSVTDRESPWLTPLTGTWRARAGPQMGQHGYWVARLGNHGS